ncbi:hypothetical protein [Elizabethkingia ursingii]|uniref:Uncharacterized protein n=1 Tax=Elizabethkingia ursingii TaxID=1756150 RepID=A0ABX3ND16_9FLAO|nr:hypothetical protein [Elizabethkingia ursingii]OPB94521.1 hypothetical protein BB021_18130 [Elizabethkingia ursingii]
MKEFEKEIQERKEYSPPTLHVVFVEMESTIAAGSATVRPGGVNQEAPKVEWELGDENIDLEIS